MIDSINITIHGEDPDAKFGQNTYSDCSLYFNGTQVVLNPRNSLLLEIDDCKAMRDFLDASIRAMENKERINDE